MQKFCPHPLGIVDLPLALLPSLPGQRIHPTNIRESGEICVGRMDDPAVLDSQRGKVSVIHEVSANPGRDEK